MRKRTLPVAVVVLLFISCQSASSDKGRPMAQKTTAAVENAAATYSYDFSKPQKQWTLPPPLQEISGNAWIDNDHLLAIEDLHPALYLLRLNQSATIEKTIPFAATSKDKFDIEDVTVAGTTAYALWSHGKLFSIDHWNSQPVVKETKTFLSKENNTEGICYDPVTKNLLIACKNESDVADEKKSTRAIYAYDIQANQLKEEPFLLVHKKDLEKVTDEKVNFYPSAIAVHPVTHDIYILSTKDTKCMAVYNHNGTIKNAFLLDKDLLPQPEGICFAPDGTLYISTEGKHGEPGRLLQYAYQKK